MNESLKTLNSRGIQNALDLFLRVYEKEREACGDLPHRDFLDREILKESLAKRVEANPSVALFRDGELTAFMICGEYFLFKGLKAAFVPEYGHAVVPELSPEEKKGIYEELYRALSSHWPAEKAQLHIIGHLAHDESLKETLFQLGFGSILCERVRKAEAFGPGGENGNIFRETDPAALLSIWKEHNGYYREPPVFLSKTSDEGEIASVIRRRFDRGDAAFVCRDDSEITGFVMVGKSADGEEGFVLQNTNSAELKIAYIKKNSRGQGMGAQLLNRAVSWAAAQGYDRIMVEHETANVTGSRFWQRYFSPYLHFSMRYVEQT